MTQGLPHTSLNGSALAGWLARLALLDGPAAKPSLLDGLAPWLSWTDAIPLAAALNGPPAAGMALATTNAAAAAAAAAAAVEREINRVQTTLGRAIADHHGAATLAEQPRPGRPPAAPAMPQADASDFAPQRRHYQRLQQRMEAAIGALRSQARAALAQRSPEMARLAAIDAVLDPVLAEREQALLAALPGLLQKHFERLRQAHDTATAATAAAPGGPGGSVSADDWLTVFRNDMQLLLRAELELRLQPALGLLEALRTPTTRAS